MATLTRTFAAAIAVGAVLLAGCTTIPRDPDGTLDRVRATGVLRAGASPGGDLVEVDGDAVSGAEVDLVEGGLTDQSPWADRVALTRPYAAGHVLAVPMGENATQFALESWLDARRP